MNKNIVIGVLALLTLLTGYLTFGSQLFGGGNVSGPIHRQTEGFPLGLQIGTNGTVMSEVKTGTCTLVVPVASQSASTTSPYDCAVTGVASGDIIAGANFSTSTSIIKENSWLIVGAKASTTAGYITFAVYNASGASNVLSRTGIASSTQYLYIDN